MKPKRALMFVIGWVSVAIIFAAGLFYFKGSTMGVEFLTCYIIEWTLSIDNLFVFLVIFQTFGVDEHRQLRALEWGIIGAIVMRLIFIFLGVALVSVFEPVLYIFGAILIYSAIKMISSKDETVDFKQNKLVLLIQRWIPITNEFVGDRFFVRRANGLMATPMLLVLVVIESSDLMFAVDSIPAAFAISKHPFVIFSANIFAILGLRSLYFLLAHADRMFVYLRYGIALVLSFVGVKMLINHYYKFNIYVSLSIVVSTLLLSIFLSWLKTRQIKE